jgi:Arc/MetJ-type ribon-helix-helix transcriptional regulator
MAYQLTPETESKVEQALATGRFQSIDEIVIEGIRTRVDLAELDRLQEIERLRKLRAAIEKTFDFHKNSPRPVSDLSLKELIEEGRRK